MNLATVFEETKCNAMHGSVTPSLVEEATGTIEMFEILLVG